MPWNWLAPRLVETTTPASPPNSALYEFESTCTSEIASSPGAALDNSPKMPADEGWPSWMYEAP